MPTLRRGGSPTRITASSEQPRILLESESPYASRRVVVESDGTATAAYLHSATTAIAATWIANHVPAPAAADMARLNAGAAPVMPAAHTKHPDGRPMLEPGVLRALWLEEGDGVAILEYGGLLAVLPGWADMSRGMPGYCRDVIGQTPFGWSLDDAMEGLAPRAAQAEFFWRWRADKDAWAEFQQSMLGHLLGRLGPGARYWMWAPGSSHWSGSPSALPSGSGRIRSCPRSG